MVKKRKPRTAPYKKPDPMPRNPAQKSGPQPRTSAKKQPKHERSNLTLHDWLTVVAWVDERRESGFKVSQQDVVEHFKNRSDKEGGALLFNQASLSRHLSAKGRAADKAHAEANPSALSAKRVRVVTRPDVEKSLYLWVKHMEEKGEHVTGHMLVEKRRRFEEMMNVPENERLQSNRWVQSFCAA
ncbi:hypothetical protein K474DRAFT_1684004 [Panus rudis PR-1116 ss-1]|nr:hypothetical protein K474DRAFT_1609120 [Panus rudis PR-1116 ss-1]KAI0077993.1 hypothetical protein K474DRAFT_1684004 [Panus rudis PR-1116 ss-1]